MLKPPGARRLALSTQAVVALTVLLCVVVLISLAISIALLRHDLERQYEQRALAVARTVATEPEIVRGVVSGPPVADGPVQREAERIRIRTGALYVVVTDKQGIRYSHPTPVNVGKRVSTSPDRALKGEDVVAIEKGTLGYSARGKVPLRTADGRIVGEVSVGIATSELDDATHKMAGLLALIALLALTVGLGGAVLLARRLRRTTLGLEPEEMADLVREHAAVLGGVRDGVVAVDDDGRITLVNPEGVRLLGREVARGQLLSEAGLGPGVLDLFNEEPPPDGVLRVVGGRVVVATRLVVARADRDLGSVLILRDRTDLDDLARELEATRALTDALRAQAHEHSNRLHTLTGMLHHGDTAEALDYLSELSRASTWVSGLDDPYLAGLMAAKAAAASEAGVRFRVSEESWVLGRVTHPLDTITVVANLLDNGIRAAAEGARTPRWVEVTLLSDGAEDRADLVVHVVDSGDGVAPAMLERVFEHGFTTRAGDLAGHGLGLALARHTARVHGGEVRLLSPGGPDAGAAFEARLGNVLADGSAPAEEGR